MGSCRAMAHVATSANRSGKRTEEHMREALSQYTPWTQWGGPSFLVACPRRGAARSRSAGLQACALVEELLAQCARHRLRLRVHLKFPVNTLNMKRDGVDADAEFRGRALVAVA